MKSGGLGFGVLCAVLLSALAQGMTAQDSDPIFAPFVSRLKAQTTGNGVALDWKDSPSVTGPVYVYRSNTPFDGRVWPDSLAEVYYGRQSYTEASPPSGKWYYLVVASDQGRQRYEMVVPFNNMIELVIDGREKAVEALGLVPVEEVPRSSARNPEANLAPVQSPQAPYSGWPRTDHFPAAIAALPVNQLTALAAVLQGNGIRISFVSASPAKSAVLYRSASPITRITDLLAAEIAHLPGASSPFIDVVKNGIPYYYAVVYDEDLRTGQAVIVPGQNATLYPVSVAQTTESPYSWQIPNHPYQVPPVSEASKLSIEAAAALSDSNWASPIPQTRAPHPQQALQTPSAVPQFGPQPSFGAFPQESGADIKASVFNSDLKPSPTGTDAGTLHLVVRDFFTWRDWAKAEPELRRLTVSSTNPEIAAKARFYLGQVYFFTGAYNNALTEFLAVQSKFHEETVPWLQLTLRALSSRL